MPETPDYKTEIALLVEMVLELYARDIGIRSCLAGRQVVWQPDLDEYIRVAEKSLACRPEVESLRRSVDSQNLSGLLQVMKGLRD